MKISEQTQKDIDRAFKALEDIYDISEALISIVDYECCNYTFIDVINKARKWAEENNEN